MNSTSTRWSTILLFQVLLIPMTVSPFAGLPDPPYYSVIFSSQRSSGDHGYGAMADRMVELAAQQPGFLGIESARGADGFGITVSYWQSLESIAVWKAQAEHGIAQAMGHATWYPHYELRIARVERAYGKQPVRKSPSTEIL